MPVGRTQLSIRGADGRDLVVDAATFAETHNVVARYYSDHFEMAQVVASTTNKTLVFRGTEMALTQALNILSPVLTGLYAAWHQVTDGSAFRAATWIGPLIGHFTVLETQLIPRIMTRAASLRDRRKELKEVVRGLASMAPKVNDIENAAIKWKQSNPGPAYRRAVECANEGNERLFDLTEGVVDRVAPGALDEVYGDVNAI